MTTIYYSLPFYKQPTSVPGGSLGRKPKSQAAASKASDTLNRPKKTSKVSSFVLVLISTLFYLSSNIVASLHVIVYYYDVCIDC